MANIVYEHPKFPLDEDEQAAYVKTYISDEYPPTKAADDLMAGRSIEINSPRQCGKTDFASKVYRELRARGRDVVVVANGARQMQRFFAGMDKVEMEANGFANPADMEKELNIRKEKPIVIIEEFNHCGVTDDQRKDWAPVLVTGSF